MSTATATTPEYVSKAAAARLLGLEPRNVDTLIRRGILRESRRYPGVQARLRRADVQAVREQFENTEAPACGA